MPVERETHMYIVHCAFVTVLVAKCRISNNSMEDMGATGDTTKEKLPKREMM